MHGCNPVYDLPDGEAFAALLRKVPLVIDCSDRLDETAAVSTIVCPDPHPLERWDDAEPAAGTLVITQPVIRPFGNTRPFVELLTAWMGERSSALEAIRSEWKRSVFARAADRAGFDAFWDDAVQHGFALVEPASGGERPFRPDVLGSPVPHISAGTDASQFSLVLYPSFAMLDGRHAHNPWLQELPDPVTKIVWDNYVSVSPAAAARLAVEEGDIVRIAAGNLAVELPAHLQPGQHDAVAAIALGYGRKGTDRFAAVGPQWLQAQPTVAPGGLVGKNAARFLALDGGMISYDARRVTLTNTGARSILACTQEHHTLEVPSYAGQEEGGRRPIIQEASLAAYVKDPAAGRFHEGELLSLWSDDHAYTGHHWGMAIDLSACTGCSACVVSCMAENNIPVVGKDEVHRNRELSWIRIDRYYEQHESGGFSVAHQPMLCQHCGNAPCETVCPVLATVHSEEGLNQQVYNRCVGTRYCSNNCPYKVRRFNWFSYELGDEMQRLVLNPDVTTRERGIMEKCSFCVQRIQEAKIEAKKNGVPVRDGDIQPACAQSCPARAIVFGDRNDPGSAISRRMRDPRSYRLLEELGVKPSIAYMTLVRNEEETRG
jgi:molybdopterin-containing oxidoreductase family iron-sulfur binding subunit